LRGGDAFERGLTTWSSDWRRRNSTVIVDALERAEFYRSVHAGIRAALDYLSRGAFRALTPGRHAVDGDRLVAILQDYQTKPAAECAWESHRRYIDVQYVIDHVERMGYAPIGAMNIKTPYNPDTEAALYEPPADGVASVATIHAGMFAIFFPHDVHQPGVMLASPAAVRKIVLKVAVEAS
jgi:YhcH/YjgK/YiaL family protein